MGNTKFARRKKYTKYLPPQMFDLESKKDGNALEKLKLGCVNIFDSFEDQLQELFLIRNPVFKLNADQGFIKLRFRNFKKDHLDGKLIQQVGKWVYFPIRNDLVHILNENEFYEVFTSRNRDLITKIEQEKLKSANVGIFGLSIGNGIANTLCMEGICNFRIVDFDHLSLSNLNRIRGSITQIKRNKAYICAEQMHDLNPYCRVQITKKQITDRGDIEKLFLGPPKLDIVIDEIDDIETKLELRKVAKKNRIALVSAADNGDNTIIDIERFDRDRETEIFHGMLKDINVSKNLLFEERLKIINKMVGETYITPRMQESLKKIGKSLYTWPQLGGAAALSAGVLVYCIKAILLGYPLKNGNYHIDLTRNFQ